MDVVVSVVDADLLDSGGLSVEIFIAGRWGKFAIRAHTDGLSFAGRWGRPPGRGLIAAIRDRGGGTRFLAFSRARTGPTPLEHDRLCRLRTDHLGGGGLGHGVHY